MRFRTSFGPSHTVGTEDEEEDKTKHITHIFIFH